MFNIMGRKIPFVLGAVPFNFFDKPTIPDHSTRKAYLEANTDETGWDRLYYMFSIDEFGSRSPEMNFIVQGTSLGTFVGAVWGGLRKAKTAHQNFIDNNHATKFTSMFEAKKKLQDAVTLNFAKGAFQFGWRLGLFTGSYVLITTTIACYRGESSIIEYTAAGLVTGIGYKIHLGPKGMLVGGGVGIFLGGIAGLISLGLLKISGTTMEEVRYWQYNWKKSRDKHVNAVYANVGQGNTALEKEHDRIVAAEKEHDRMVVAEKELIPATTEVKSSKQ